MKTIAVVLTAMLVAMSLMVKSNKHVSFGVEFVVEQSFSPKSINVKVVTGQFKKGDVIALQKHNDYLLALRDKYYINSNTTNKAEVKAFFMNEEIELEDAFLLMNDYNGFDKQNMDANIKTVPNDFYYAIRILTNDTQSLQDYVKVCPELEKQIMQIDDHIFVAGKIENYSKALEFQDKFVKAGLKNNVVVAYEGTKQVPVYLVAKNE